jgi:prophage regulatory protein
MQTAQKFLRLPAVVQLTGVPCSGIYEQMAGGTFPRPVPIGKRAVAWLETEIIDWQKRQIAARDGRRSPRKARAA